MLLRVIFSSEDIRVLRLDPLPETTEDLQSALRSSFNIEGAFTLQYKDPGFGNALCDLTRLQDLPPKKATLKVLCQKKPTHNSTDSSQSDFTHDTASLTLSLDTTASKRSKHWPVPFIIPSFSFDVESQLRHGNEKYAKNGLVLTISKAVKNEILDKLACALYSFKAYPSNEEFESVAMTLTEKHPCLKEPGSVSGWCGWKTGLKFRIGNFRNKLYDAGRKELSVNRGRCRDGSSKGTQMNRSSRSEKNFLPDLPEGKSLACLEKERSCIQSEMKWRSPDWVLVDEAMDSTFSLRRKEVLEDEPLVEELRKQWPALFTPRQVALEFRRLMSIDLMKSFYEGLDQHLPKLLVCYGRKPTTGSVLQKLTQSLDKENSKQRRREAALLGLPYFMKENPKDFFRTLEPTGDEKQALCGVQIGILTVAEDTKEDEVFPVDVVDVAVVIEERIVIQDLHDLPRAFAILIGLLYALNLDYPKELRYSFEVALEFRRLMSIDLMKSFYEGLDQHLPKLLVCYGRKPTTGSVLQKLTQSLDKENSKQRRREAALLGLPYFMKENPKDFFRTLEPTGDEKQALCGVQIGILTVAEDTKEDEVFPVDVVDVAVVIEERIVIQDLHDLPRAFAILIGLLYALNLDYPKELRYSFEVIQRLFMKIDGQSCSARVHALKKNLLR